MSTGWIKLHRKLLGSRVFANEGLLRLWIYCLCRANHEKNYVDIQTGKGNTEVEVNAGEFIFGRNSVSNDLGVNPSTLYKRMKKLESIGNINIQSNSHYSIVSICNWEVYQNKENEKEQAKEQAGNNQVTGKEQASNTDKNDKNVKNDKNTHTPPSFEEVKTYFQEKGFNNGLAKRFYEYYNEPMEDRGGRVWKDQNGKTVKSWKQKAIAVWMKDKNKSEPTPEYMKEL